MPCFVCVCVWGGGGERIEGGRGTRYCITITLHLCYIPHFMRRAQE